MIKSILLSLVVAVSALVATPLTANALFEDAKDDACAGSQLTTAAPNCSDTASDEVDSLLSTIVNILSTIIGIVAVIIIIVNGLRFITAGGDANSISSARNGIIYAIVGLILVGLAQVIVRFVLTQTN